MFTTIDDIYKNLRFMTNTHFIIHTAFLSHWNLGRLSDLALITSNRKPIESEISNNDNVYFILLNKMLLHEIFDFFIEVFSYNKAFDNYDCPF